MTAIPSAPKPFGHWLTAESRARSLRTAVANLELGRTRRWRGRIPIPKRVHPLVRRFFEILNEEHTTIAEVAERSGIRRVTLSEWRYKRTAPHLTLMIAAFQCVGYDLRPVKIYKDRGRVV